MTAAWDALLADAGRVLARQYGLELASIGTTVLGTALDDAGRALGMAPAALAARLREPACISALFNALPVGLSWFDRDPVQLKSAADWAAAQQRPLRVLSAPCARGEEVWSLAAALLDAGTPASTLQIIGIDAMPAAIAQAEAGTYATASLSGRLTSRPWWLLETGTELCVHPRLRPVARFHCANLLDPGALVGLGPFDLILSRNFLIYLTGDARQQWCATLASALSVGGRLYVAASEPIGQWRADFASITGDVLGAHVRAGEAASPARPAVGSGVASEAAGDSGADPRVTAEASAGVLANLRQIPLGADRRRLLRNHSSVAAVAPISLVPAAVTAPAAGSTLAEADPRALADAGQLAEAERLLAERLSRPVPAAADLVTSALLALARGRRDLAEDALRRALFLDHRHQEAASLLAALLDQRGNVDDATRLRARLGAAS